MSRDSGSEQSGQRTVAELIAQYGGDTLQNGRRRRRRAADPSDTAPQEIIERIQSEGGQLPAVPPEAPPSRSTGPTPVSPVRGGGPAAAPEVATARPGNEARDHWVRRFAAAEPPPPARPAGPAEPSSYEDPESTIQHPVWQQLQSPKPPVDPAAPDVGLRRSRAEREAATDQFRPVKAPPVFDAAETELPTAVSPRVRAIEAEAGPVELDEESGSEFAGYGAVEPDDHDPPVPAEAERSAEPEPAEEQGSSYREWLALALQGTVGLLGGAGVWVGFRWLWLSIPVAAVAAAVAVTGCLVVVARKSSHTGDLQTVVLAVLVGLACTVSPVAVMLVGQ